MSYTLDNIIKNIESYSLTDIDIENALNNKYSIYRYHKLAEFDNIDQCLGNNGGFIILFQNETSDSGHLTCIFKRDYNTLEFFDSYGLMPDEELKYSDYNLRIHNNKKVPHLSHLIEQSNYNIVYNKYKFQKIKKHVNTCARHCIIRLKYRNLTIDEYKKFIADNRNDADYNVSVLTFDIP